jgi:hypothetical protein
MIGAGGIGSKLGGMAGGYLGDKASDFVEKSLGIKGHGAYYTNQLINPSMKAMQTPVVSSAFNETGDFIVSRCEFIQDLTANGTAFQALFSSYINPGNQTMFPWLSQFAPYFEQFEFLQLIFDFRSTVTGGNQNSAGAIICTCQYNAYSVPFQTKAQAESYAYTRSCKSDDSILFGVECQPGKTGHDKVLYIRNGNVGQQDLKTYDWGTFGLYTSGTPVGMGLLGELWVGYKIRLSKCKYSLPGIVSPNTLNFYLNAGVLNPTGLANLTGAAAGATTAMPALVAQGWNCSDALGVLGFTISQTANFNESVINFPVYITTGIYSIRIKCLCDVANAATSAIQVLGISNCTAKTVQASTQLAANTVSEVSFVVRINAPGTTVASVRIGTGVAGDFGGYTAATAVSRFRHYMTISQMGWNFDNDANYANLSA